MRQDTLYDTLTVTSWMPFCFLCTLYYKVFNSLSAACNGMFLQLKLVTVEAMESRRRLVMSMRRNWTRCRRSWRSCRRRNESTPNCCATRLITKLSYGLFATTLPASSSLKSVPWSIDIYWLAVIVICLQCFDTVGWVFWPIKPVPDMTYNVFGGTLNLA